MIGPKMDQVGSSPWDKHEQKVLEDGLRYYPHERHSNMLIYIRIAASLPRKTVRDVAHHLRHMQAGSFAWNSFIRFEGRIFFVVAVLVLVFSPLLFCVCVCKYHVARSEGRGG